MSQRTKITKEMSAEIKRLWLEGWAVERICPRVGLRHSQVAQHLWWINLSPEDRAKKWIASKEKRRLRMQEKRVIPGPGTTMDRPPPEVIAERDMRRSRPYSIRFDVLGEPEPGRSALDQKMAATAMSAR